MTTWLELCRAFARESRVEPRWIKALDSFGETRGLGGLHASSFRALEEHLGSLWSALPSQIEAALCTEVDAPQAALFTRRMCTVVELLEPLADRHDAGRLLRAGLLARMAEIVEGSAGLPRALRVRAAVDFYYSQAALLHHLSSLDDTQLYPWSEILSRSPSRPIADGVHYTTVAQMTPLGPQRVHVVQAESGRLRMKSIDRRSQVEAGLSLEDEARQLGALVAISGGFFLYSEPDITPPSRRGDPVGLILSDGRLLSPPVFRRSALVSNIRQRFSIEASNLVGCRVQVLGQSWTVAHPLTKNVPTSRALFFNRAGPQSLPSGPQISIVGSHVVCTSQREPLPIPLNGYVLLLPESAVALPPPESPVDTHLPGSCEDWESAMAGGPLLVENGRAVLDLPAEDFSGTAPPRTFSGDETGDQNLLPRMAAGIDERGTLSLVAVEGRDFQHALGLTLGALSELMIGLGCTRAMNLDGGSSKRMIVSGRQVDRSSTEVLQSRDPAPQRPVRSAVFFWS